MRRAMYQVLMFPFATLGLVAATLDTLWTLSGHLADEWISRIDAASKGAEKEQEQQ